MNRRVREEAILAAVRMASVIHDLAAVFEADKATALATAVA
jgi:hypothetical protein